MYDIFELLFPIVFRPSETLAVLQILHVVLAVVRLALERHIAVRFAPIPKIEHCQGEINNVE
jgi:hypothetical protein